MTGVQAETVNLVRLRVTTDGDPSALTRVLGYFQNLNVTPERIVAEFGTTAFMYLAIDICGIPEDRLSVLTAKIGQNPSVLTAYWHYF